MMSLISEFDHWKRNRALQNPDSGESVKTAFIQHMAEEKKLLDYTEVDWLALAEKLGLSDDQFGAMMEGVASWIPEEPVPPSEQQPADWPDEIPKKGI